MTKKTYITVADNGHSVYKSVVTLDCILSEFTVAYNPIVYDDLDKGEIRFETDDVSIYIFFRENDINDIIRGGGIQLPDQCDYKHLMNHGLNIPPLGLLYIIRDDTRYDICDQLVIFENTIFLDNIGVSHENPSGHRSLVIIASRV